MLLELIEEMLTLIGGLFVVYAVYVLITRRNDKPSTDSPNMAHTALREIVERAVDEARKLPSLGGSGETGREGRNIAEHSYEDLLATAILNKVIEKFQREQIDGNSNVLLGKPATRTTCMLSESELGLDEGVEDGSSLEPLSQDDCSSNCDASCSRHARNLPEPVSLTIEERIEEVTTTYTSDEEHRDNDIVAIRNSHRVPFPEFGMDIIDPSQESAEDSQDEPDTPTPHVDMVSPVESWEENWLFQKKRVQTQADPVSMLVPNPSSDFKALIGDKDAEDTSDLSECSSAQSDEEIEKELMEAINNVVPRSPKKAEIQANLEAELDGFPEPKTASNGVHDDGDDKGIKNSMGSPGLPVEAVIQKKEPCAKAESQESSEKVKPSNGENETKEPNFKVDPQLQNQEPTVVVDLESLETGKTSSASENAGVDTVDCKTVPDRLKGIAISSEESAVPDAPKTPTCTPTRISVTEENSVETANDGETYAASEKILSSLERAKKKLMVVDDAEEEEEKTKADCDKVDFPTEDVQQESEYTEHYDIATQRHLDSLTKIDAGENEAPNNETSNQSVDSFQNDASKCREAVALAKAESASHFTARTAKDEEEVRLATPPRPGTIAEREHKKWENAPPIENNPYSEENIQKRLWERQYASRPSDIPGAHAELAKSNGTDLEVVLTPQEPNIKRFGRDYYINEAKAASGERGRRSAASVSSRPSSSLSQRSSSTGGEQEQQEDAPYKNSDFPSIRSNDVKSKVAKWQRNNADTNYQAVHRTGSSNGAIEPFDAENVDERCSRKNRQKSWEDQRVEDILENERKNSKNEINAKLNNQDNYDSVTETKKSFADENQRKIRRIDLKAYGFENEFISSNDTSMKSQRVVNKLDLKSFGYDGGIRRTQSNNHLDSTVNEGDLKPRIVKVTNKSNLTRRSDYQANDCRELIETEASGDSLAHSTEALNELRGGRYAFGSLKTAKSVPDMGKCEYYDEDEEIGYDVLNSYDGRNGNETTGSKEFESCDEKEGEGSNEESENDLYNSLEEEQGGEREEANVRSLGSRSGMPSVRRLAEAFSKQPESLPAPLSRTKPSPGIERSSTPEIHIVESPRQMHSLTARSLSKKFREGLRQIPNKVTSPPASHVTMERARLAEIQPEVVQTKGELALNDTNVIAPGKLKSNIKFWEQMQRRS